MYQAETDTDALLSDENSQAQRVMVLGQIEVK